MKKRRVISIVAAITVIIVVVVVVLRHRGGAPPPAAKTQPSVSAVTASYARYVERVNAVGRIGAAAGSETKLSFAEAGILQSVDVRIGERVSAGEPLAQLDASGLSLAAAQAQADANVASANEQVSAVDKTTTKIAVDVAALRREQSLYSAGVAALKDVQAARAQLAADRAEAASASAQVHAAGAQVQSAQDRAALAQRDLANGTLRSPVGGVVTALYKRPGEAVDPTTPVLSIGPNSAQNVTLDLASGDASRVRTGDAVTLTIPGSSLRTRGRVIGISPALDPATQTATVVVSGVPSGAPSGSAVQAVIDVGTDRGIVIPQTAVVQDPQSSDTLVFVQTQNKDGTITFAQRTVTIAHSDGAKALVSSGLRAGERIAAQGAFALLAPAGGG